MLKATVAEVLAMRADPRPRDWALFDIRERGEADACHIWGATSLPRRQLEFRIADLVPARRTRIVLYDDGEGRAALAAATLQRCGYAQARHLEGGLSAWRAAGGSVISGSNVPSKAFGERVHVGEHPPALTAAELRRRVASGEKLVICDVRTPEEYREAHIPGGYEAPSFDFVLNALDLSRKFDTVIVNCAGRTRSIIAVRTLQLLGVDNAFALENGTSGWLLEGLALEKDQLRRLEPPSDRSRADVIARAEALAHSAGVASLSPEAVAERTAARGDSAVYAFDVRSLVHYRLGHVPGTLALPGGQAIQRSDDFFAVPSAEIILVDDGDARAAVTGYWLRRMGYPKVARLAGGLPAWLAEGRPVETGRPRAEPLGLSAATKAARFIDASDVRDGATASAARVVIDVGPSRQYAAAHMPKSRWLPRGWLELRALDVAGPPSTTLVVTASEEAQAVFAAATLGEMGYRDLSVLRGGTRSWRDAGGRLEKGEPAERYGGDDYVLPPYLKGAEAMQQYLKWEIELTEGAGPAVHGQL